MKKKKLQCNTFVCNDFVRVAICLIVLLLLTSCGAKKDTQMSNPNDLMPSGIDTNKKLEPPNIEDAYYLPLPIDTILKSNPNNLIDDSSDASIKKIIDDIDVDAGEELKKYLNRRRAYDKSEIFREIP